ncbi:MAG: hypothetical protein RDU25_00700 [Patescibacteria group bacterium]|nr:hypothetical protein [Patescibacteria group bacterium]
MEKPNFKNEQPKKQVGQEGYTVDEKGESMGDAKFHEVAMGTTPVQEEKDLAELDELEVGLAERQVRKIMEANKAAGLRGYRGLIALYPNHPNRAEWEKMLNTSE